MHDLIEEMPTFLRRQPKENNMPQPEKKKRTKVELPTQIEDGDNVIDLSKATLAELADLQFQRKDTIANIEVTKLELRAINTAIRARAR